MATTCTTSFIINFSLGANAQITGGAIAVQPDLRPGFTQIHYWTANFSYVTGDPAATAFRLNSADGLTGSFSPSRPNVTDNPLDVQSGLVSGTIAIVLPPGTHATYTGTVTIVQA